MHTVCRNIPTYTLTQTMPTAMLKTAALLTVSNTACESLQLSAPLTAAKHRPLKEAANITTTPTVDAS